METGCHNFINDCFNQLTPNIIDFDCNSDLFWKREGDIRYRVERIRVVIMKSICEWNLLLFINYIMWIISTYGVGFITCSFRVFGNYIESVCALRERQRTGVTQFCSGSDLLKDTAICLSEDEKLWIIS